jgi:hypothetical protein
MSANLPEGKLIVAKLHCGGCGRLHLLDLRPGVDGADILQARWWDGWAEIDHGGWLCPTCIGNHADHELRNAAEVVRERHGKIRFAKGPKADEWRKK